MYQLSKYIAIGIVLFLLVGISIAGEKYIANNVAAAQFTTRVVNREPVDNIKRLESEYKRVYFFVDIRDCVGCKIEHQWWHKGKMVSSVKGKSKYDRFRWWSSKTLTQYFLGDWTVKVLINDRIRYSKTFRYYEPTRQQKQVAPIQKRIQVQEMSECEVQLRYFSDKVKETPDEPYFNFMLKKWGKRCLPE